MKVGLKFYRFFSRREKSKLFSVNVLPAGKSALLGLLVVVVYVKTTKGNIQRVWARFLLLQERVPPFL